MRHRDIIRYFVPILAILTMGVVLLTSSGRTQQPTAQRPAWDVQMARNAQAKSTITIQNQCQRPHNFTVTEQQTPFLQLLAAATVTVPGNSNYEVPVRFDTSGMNAGEYRGTVVVKCDTCRKEKTCKQDREVLPVHLVVRGENGPQMTPENPTQPQVPGPPINFQEKPSPPKPAIAVTATANGEEWDENGKKKEDVKDIAFKETIKPCKIQKCPKLKTIGSGKDLKIYCQAIEECGGSGEDCKNAQCFMLVATTDDPKNPATWVQDTSSGGAAGHGVIKSEKTIGKDKDKEIKEAAFKPLKGHAYRCSCL